MCLAGKVHFTCKIGSIIYSRFIRIFHLDICRLKMFCMIHDLQLTCATLCKISTDDFFVLPPSQVHNVICIIYKDDKLKEN